jgi:hypothetical protein
MDDEHAFIITGSRRRIEQAHIAIANTAAGLARTAAFIAAAERTLATANRALLGRPDNPPSSRQ